MTGEGAVSIREWCEMTDLRMVRLWLEGYSRRHRVHYDIGKVVARTIAKTAIKHVPDDFPYVMPWENIVDDPTAGMTEEEKQAELQKMIKSIYGKE